MNPYTIYRAQENNSIGSLQVNVVSAENNFPIPDAEITILIQETPLVLWSR